MTLDGGGPFIVERLVRWGECDPAGIVYTPNFLDYAVDAARLFIRETTQRRHGAPDACGLNLPAKALNATFHSPLYCDDVLIMRPAFVRLGNSSFDVTVHGSRGHERASIFDAKITFVSIANNPRQPLPLPASFRNMIDQILQTRSG